MHLEEEPPAWEHQMMTGSPLPLSPSPPDEPSKKKTGAGEEMRWRNWTVAQRGGEARPRRGRGREWESFTCKPLKKLVVTCVPLESLFAPLCHRLELLCPLCHSVKDLLVFCRLGVLTYGTGQVKCPFYPLSQYEVGLHLSLCFNYPGSPRLLSRSSPGSGIHGGGAWVRGLPAGAGCRARDRDVARSGARG
jgi:hypothetical protein